MSENNISAEKKLKAWCEWRKWCSVARVKNPLPEAYEKEQGKIDDIVPEERNELHFYLINRVLGCIRNERRIINGETIYLDNLDSDDAFLSYFDFFMKDQKKRISEDFAKTPSHSYKDFVFYNMEISQDPPMMVLNGKIFGRKGYIKDIIKKYILEYCDDKLPMVSLDQSLADDSEETYHDVIADNRQEAISKAIANEAFVALCEDFDDKEKIFILAESYRIPMTDPAITEALDLQKSVLYEYKAKAIKKLGEKIQQLQIEEYVTSMQEAMKDIILQLKKTLPPEKSFRSFLNRIEQNDNNNMEVSDDE